MENDEFKIERGFNKELYLKDGKHSCFSKTSVENLLESDIFVKHNASLVPIFEEAKKMMNNDQTGTVNPSWITILNSITTT